MNKKKTKRRTPQKSKHTRSQKSPLAWLIGGVFIGFSIAGIIYVKTSHHAIEQTIKAEEKQLVPHAQNLSQNHKHHPIKDTSSPSKNQYDFYNLLASPEENSIAKENDNEESQNTTFVVEIAKFNNYNEADNLKAQLTLLGIDNVIIAKKSKANPFFKVIAGPYHSRAEASKVQSQLIEHNIHSILVVG